MSKVLTFSRTFPANHPRKGQPTYFVEKFWNSLRDNDLPLPKNIDFPESFMWSILPLSNFGPKHHTIRSGNRFKVGDKFSPRVWSGKPYRSKQIIIAPDIEVKKVWDIEITTESDDGESDWSYVEFLGKFYTAYGYGGYDKEIMVQIAKNDGLSISDFYKWFLTGRSKKQILNNEPKIFKGQIICWSDNVNY